MQPITVTLTLAGLARMPWNSSRPIGRAPSIELRCPECREYLGSISYRSLSRNISSFCCPGCSATLEREKGIWRALPSSREAHFAQFIRDYEQIRRAEGRGSDASEFYLNLPYRDLTGRNSWQWAIRAKTFRYIKQEILPRLREEADSALAILDLGAGNGWMSHLFASAGHRPVAVDLITNSYDGLGAAIHFQRVLPELFPRFQAELDNLPFADGQFDCAIFNASFHYSENYDRTLAEAIRCLRPGGTILIADSPTYSMVASGQQMRKERQDYFLKRFGFRSDGLVSCDYLTPERLIALEVRHDLEWTTHRPWYGIGWACRPWLARLRGRREPSQFFLYTAQVKTR